MHFSNLLSTIYHLLLPQAAHAQTATLPNPLAASGITDVPTLAGHIINGWFLLPAGVAALIFFVWGGFDWIISQGNEEQIAMGKKKMIWATLGLVAIMVSYAVVNAFLKFVFGI